jgi:protoheme IX farnesyltransferase
LPAASSSEVITSSTATRPAGELLSLCLELGKARLTALVVGTAVVGYLLASGGQIDWIRLVLTTLGTALTALGANALNQWLEASRDALMHRTRTRPLPSGRLPVPVALAFAGLVSVLGPIVLGLAVDREAALLALAAWALYVLVYTPLKTRSPLNTLVGAIVGAIPPMIGWQAAAGRLEPGAWALAGILFLWQIPHFLALAWLYREDYRRSGFRMLPVVDPSGHLTGCVVAMYSLLLLPLAVGLTFLGTCGWTYGAGSLVLGTGLLGVGVWLERRRTEAAARRVFVASLVYLPLLLALMVVDHGRGVL